MAIAFRGLCAAELVAAGMTWNPGARGPFGSLRLRRFGAYPLIEDNSVRD